MIRHSWIIYLLHVCPCWMSNICSMSLNVDMVYLLNVSESWISCIYSMSLNVGTHVFIQCRLCWISYICLMLVIDESHIFVQCHSLLDIKYLFYVAQCWISYVCLMSLNVGYHIFIVCRSLFEYVFGLMMYLDSVYITRSSYLHQNDWIMTEFDGLCVVFCFPDIELMLL